MGFNIVGEERSFFYYGEKYTFQYVGNNDWKCVSGQSIIPPYVRNLLKEVI